MNIKVADIEEIENNINYDNNFEIYRNILNNLLEWVINYDKNNLENIRTVFTKVFNKIYRSTYTKYNSKNLIIKKNVIINIFKKIYDFENPDPNIQLLGTLLQKKPSRNISGITSITVITHPYPNGQSFSCKHN